MKKNRTTEGRRERSKESVNQRPSRGRAPGHHGERAGHEVEAPADHPGVDSLLEVALWQEPDGEAEHHQRAQTHGEEQHPHRHEEDPADDETPHPEHG